MRDATARKTHILVTGFPRSGTSLFYNMLCSSLEDFAFDDWEIPALDTLWRYENHVTKRPFDLFALDDIVAANVHRKRLIVIAAIRDLRDITTSIHAMAPDVYLIGHEGCYELGGTFPNYERPFTGPGIGAFHEALTRWRHSAEIELQMLRYEDLVADPDAVQQRLAERLGLRFRSRFSDFHRHRDRHAIRFEGERAPLAPDLVKINDPVSKGYVGRWAEPRHRARICEQFTQHPELLEMLRFYGYEKDDEWFASFECTQP